MPYSWQSVEEAAVTLGISARTLHRRIAKDEVETRLANGRREVLVCLPDDQGDEVACEVTDIPVSPRPFSTDPIESQPEPTFAPQTASFNQTSSQSPQTSYAQSSAQQASPEMSTAIVLAEKEIAMANERVRRTELALAAFQHTSQLLQREAGRSRVSARLAWAAVAILSVGVYIAVGWTASRITRAKADNEHLSTQLQNLSADAQQKAAEVQQLREQLSKSQQTAARTQGELEITRMNLAEQKKPATQPSWLHRLVNLNMD